MFPTRALQRVGSGYFSGLHRLNNRFYALITLPHPYFVESAYSDYSNPLLATSNNDGVLNTLLLEQHNALPAIEMKKVKVDNTEWYIPSKHELIAMQNWYCSGSTAYWKGYTRFRKWITNADISRWVGTSTVYECLVMHHTYYSAVGTLDVYGYPYLDGAGTDFEVLFLPTRRILITGE